MEEKVISKDPLPYGGAEERPGPEQMAFWNWTRISEAKKEREEGGCGSLGSGSVAPHLFSFCRVDLTFF